MFIIFKSKRFIPPRIRRTKEVPGCDEKKSYILRGKNCSTLKESRSSKKKKKKQKENREAIMETRRN